MSIAHLILHFGVSDVLYEGMQCVSHGLRRDTTCDRIKEQGGAECEGQVGPHNEDMWQETLVKIPKGGTSITGRRDGLHFTPLCYST